MTSSDRPFRRRYHPDAAGLPDSWRHRCYEVVFGSDTRAGRTFDLVLIALIVASVGIAVLDSVHNLHLDYGSWLYGFEWLFTLLFTAEYLMRLLIVRAPLRYALSFFGVIDLLAVLPTYLSLLLPGAQSLLVVRILRVLRVFRILRLARYVDEAGMLFSALQRSWRKIFVFLLAILTIVTVFGALMYVIEGPEHGFTSIPTGMYWAVVTDATVGFGDLAPHTELGRLVTSILILIGYGIIAVPTGIYTAELAHGLRREWNSRTCPRCVLVGHERDAIHCRRCGHDLAETEPRV